MNSSSTMSTSRGAIKSGEENPVLDSSTQRGEIGMKAGLASGSLLGSSRFHTIWMTAITILMAIVVILSSVSLARVNS